MLIAVNCRLLLYGRLEGIGRYMDETLPLLVKAHPQHQFLFIFDRAWHPSFIYADNVKAIKVGPQARHPFLYYLWFEWMLPMVFTKYKVDLFLSLDGYLSLRTDIPQVNVIHDLAFEHFPEGISQINVWHYKKYFQQYCRKAAHIATVSEYTKSDILKTYGIAPEKITVTGNAANSSFEPLAKEEQEVVKKKYNNGCPYFLYTGAIHPRKNIGNLLLAFDYFKTKNNTTIKLLVAGREAWKNEEMKEIYNSMRHKYDVVFIGRLSDAELQEVMASALGLCYVSLFEGFGIPIIEAMQCGTPVITSNTTSMPEVAGGAALIADPLSPTEIAERMEQLLSEETRNELAANGLENAKRYTWEKAAVKLWEAVEKAMSI